MKKLKRSFIFAAVLTGLIIISCEKDPGVGGTSVITGKVLVREYNANFTVLTEQYYGPDVDVYIIYGDDPVYGDKFSTSYDGTYRFEYLREGKYTVFAYSEDSANYPTQKKIPVMREVKITERNQTVTVPEIVILK
jgi:hypothetical protein